MELFYTSGEFIDLGAAKITIAGDEFHHLSRVLRKQTGEKILVTDGNGLRCEVIITAVGKKSLEGEIVEHSLVEKSDTEVVVALSMLKSPQRFDFFLEKATELGISEIIPMVTRRTVSLPSNEKIEGKISRWKNIILSAARQSKRYYLPGLHVPKPFSTVVHLEGYDVRLIPYEGSAKPPVFASSGNKILILIGPEGGFAAGEVEESKDEGFLEISLGKTTLRAETAAIFAVAMVRSQLLEGSEKEWL
ncbi:MAG: 16S rRNA (uracil(1498)-N(3))-methyltransferase [Chlorobiaceae bacterium]|jgi:16S rRNA (uracil1498-N3)-methyltransferase|nr:16S rRNA (uracil(1498)-N(3))-methyltransferase [Chlorobiaceae bacterium]